jgi:antitoxin (DNA-binding transcriptional repressor) of toxin-antitoxin stability system
MAKNAMRVLEEEAANDFASLMARVRAGAEVVIE